VSERDEGRHVATGDAAPAAPADPDPGRPSEAPASGAEKVEVTGPAVDADVLQAVVDFIDDLVESDEGDGDPGTGLHGEVPPKGADT
jgi:hypothetical protein